MLVFDDNLVLSLISGLDFGDGHHDHVVVVAVADQLVPSTFLDHCGTLIELEGWGGVALNEHVAAGSLVFHCTVLLLDLHNPWRSGLPDSLEGHGRFVQPALPLGLLVPGCILASTSPKNIVFILLMSIFNFRSSPDLPFYVVDSSNVVQLLLLLLLDPVQG